MLPDAFGMLSECLQSASRVLCFQSVVFPERSQSAFFQIFLGDPKSLLLTTLQRGTFLHTSACFFPRCWTERRQ